MVAADRTEALTLSALQAFFVNRIELKEAVLSLGLYSEEVRKLLRRGHTAAKRICQMDQTQIRAMLLALVPRAEVNASELTLYVSCYETSRFLGWDGVGLFEKSALKRHHDAERVHVLHAPAFLICGHPRFALPIDPSPIALRLQTRALRPYLERPTSCVSSFSQFAASRFQSWRGKKGWDRVYSRDCYG